MNNRSGVNTWRALMAKVLVAVIVMLTVLVIPSAVTEAASAPTLSKTSRNILIGASYNLDINNKVKRSTYTWTSSNKSIATVTSKGIVKGITKGAAVITCSVKTPIKTYKLTCKVTIIKPASSFAIKNKVTALNLGQYYNADRTITPSTSDDKTTWSTSNKAIAVPNTKGIFTALSVGTVTITGKTLSGKTDSMTIQVVDKEGTVATQEELTALLGSGVSLITIKTNETVDLTIPSGNYAKTKLVVDAPNADIHNYGVFSSIVIKQIAANSWYENAVGNLLSIIATDSRIVVTQNAIVKIEVNKESATLKIENNGVIQEIAVVNAADIDIAGKSTKDIPVKINIANLSLTTSIPLNLDITKRIDLTLLAGAEATKVKVTSTEIIPTITGNSTVVVTVGTGTTATQQEVIPTPLPTQAPTPTYGGGGFGGGGSTGGSTGTAVVTETVNSDGSISYRLPQPYTAITAINVTYQGSTFAIDGGTLLILKPFLANDSVAISIWKGITNTSTNYSGQNMTVTGVSGSSTKTVLFHGGQLDQKTYLITVGNDNSVTMTNVDTNVTFTVTKVDDYTLKISANHSDITFSPTFN